VTAPRRLLAALLLLAAPPALAQGYPAEPLFSTGQTIVGEPIAYPPGQAQVDAAIVTLAPGETTIAHRHGVPFFAYILEGEITVDYGPHGRRTYRKGDAFMEAMGVTHAGTNTGTVPVRILGVYMGAKGAHPVIPEKR
jgi:quercetin dioxygenase-like cupin family protein